MNARTRTVGLLASLLTITLGGLGTSGARADAIRFDSRGLIDRLGYDTAGEVPAAVSTVSGPEVIRFEGVSGEPIDPTSPLRLGEFVITPVAGTSTTYNHTPFAIEVRVPSLTRFDGSYHVASMVIDGFLDGMVGASGQSDVVATIASTRLGTAYVGPLLTVPYIYEFPYSLDAVTIAGPSVLGSSDGGRSPLEARITPVPEPAAITLFGVLSLGAVLRRGARGTPA